ncbi:hypothetical protein HPULCUR_004552 [Helicostylum pulchrum]|uniref:Uncharacterized protein n=1 Tax=Helicostylum pulchrum TaxID=562976 RepID=A0ABP9XWK3_9FUNG
MSDNQNYMESSSYTSVTQQTDSNIKQEYVQESSYSQYTSKNNDANDVKLSSTSNKYSDVGPTPRSYLDSTVVPTLLEGLKLLATERGVKSTPEKTEPIFQAHNLASDWSYESGEEILNNSSFDGVPTTDARRRINDQLKKMCFEYFELHPLFKRAIGFASCPINLSDFNKVAAIMMGRN